MAVLLVTYDLNKQGQNYSKFLEVVKSYAWVRLSESSYAIETSKSPDMVYRELKPFADENDSFLIIGLKNPHQGWIEKSVHDWLNQKLG